MAANVPRVPNRHERRKARAISRRTPPKNPPAENVTSWKRKAKRAREAKQHGMNAATKLVVGIWASGSRPVRQLPEELERKVTRIRERASMQDAARAA